MRSSTAPRLVVAAAVVAGELELAADVPLAFVSQSAAAVARPDPEAEDEKSHSMAFN